MPDIQHQQQPTQLTETVTRGAIDRIREHLRNAGILGYAIEIPQRFLETELPGVAVAVQDLGRFAIVLQCSGDVNAGVGAPDLAGQQGPPTPPHPLHAIDAAVSYEVALRRLTRCYAEVMPVMALNTEPTAAFRRSCVSLEVHIAKAGPDLVAELRRLASQVEGCTWPSAEQFKEEGPAITAAWKRVQKR